MSRLNGGEECSSCTLNVYLLHTHFSLLKLSADGKPVKEAEIIEWTNNKVFAKKSLSDTCILD